MTWDGAGNLPPAAAVAGALASAGHEAHILAHDVQRPAFETMPAAFHRFETAPQWDVGQPGALGEDPVGRIMDFQGGAATDACTVAARLDPAVVLVDCMLPNALTAVKAAGFPTVALVHALYSFFAEYVDGVFKGPGFKERSRAFAAKVATEPGIERAVELLEALAAG